jgi:ABC-type transporter Mla subunit MlaD
MEIEALKLVAYQGGGVVGVIAVCLIFIKALGKRDDTIERIATSFTTSNESNQKAHREEVARLVDDHVTLTRETVKAVGRLDATVRSVERTVMGVEQSVGDLKTVVTILSRDREREQEAKEGKA